MVGRSKKAIFAQIREHVGKKLKGWKERILSRGGKEILIKAMAQDIPTYAMSCFMMPLELCEELEQMMCKFWWGMILTDEKSIGWIGKECVSKEEEGMGFRDIEGFNTALLDRQGWRVCQDPDSLLSRMLKARYSAQRVHDSEIGSQS